MAKTSAKAPRRDFAFPEKKAFPLNTPGRRKVAVKDAVMSERAGNISSSDVAKIKRAVASKSGGKSKPMKKCGGCGGMTKAAMCPSCGRSM